jgi:HemK-related putative methylase
MLPSPPRRLAALLARAWLRVRYRVFTRRYRRLSLETIDGVSLLVLPEVFNPVLLRTGAFMARAVNGLPLGGGVSVLDLGSGSGVGAIFAARCGARVVAVDINEEAVRCARINALLNRVEDRVEVRHGDLLEPVRGERFDVVLFNPPFYRGRPRDRLDHAWRGADVFERFAGGLAQVLTPGGYALLVLSSDGDCDQLLAELTAQGFRHEVLQRKDLINETLAIYAVRPASGA